MIDWRTPFENELRTLDCRIVILEDIKEIIVLTPDKKYNRKRQHDIFEVEYKFLKEYTGFGDYLVQSLPIWSWDEERYRSFRDTEDDF